MAQKKKVQKKSRFIVTGRINNWIPGSFGYFEIAQHKFAQDRLNYEVDLSNSLG